MTYLINGIYAVEVPEGMEAFKIDCIPEIDFYELDCYQLGEYDEPVQEKSISLPAGNWQLICTTKEVTEEQAKGIVGNSEWFFPERHTRYIDYEQLVGPDNKQAWNAGFSNALLSLRSLLTSKNLDPNKNYILIKKLP